jgi:hypothetical protein
MMSEPADAFHSGVAAGVAQLPKIPPDEYFGQPYLVETWFDGYQEGLIRDHHYVKQLEIEYEW